jgi:hypothetical protein
MTTQLTTTQTTSNADNDNATQTTDNNADNG